MSDRRERRCGLEESAEWRVRTLSFRTINAFYHKGEGMSRKKEGESAGRAVEYGRGRIFVVWVRKNILFFLEDAIFIC